MIKRLICVLALLAVAPLFGAGFTASDLTVTISSSTDQAKPERIRFAGIVYPADQPAITAHSKFPEGDPFNLFAKLLACYHEKSVENALPLYTRESQPKIQAYIEKYGKEQILEAFSKITQLQPRVFWIEAPHTGVFYAINADAGSSVSVLPFVITREDGQWKFVATHLESELGNIIDRIAYKKHWDRFDIAKTPGGQQDIDVAKALESDTFDTFPQILP